MNRHYEIITSEKFNELCEEEDRANGDWLDALDPIEIDGLLYQPWIDIRHSKTYVVRMIRTVYMGFNDSPADKVKEFTDIVEREGCCKASWGVTGRTAHKTLGFELARMLPQYRFEIGDQYECTGFAK